MQFVKILAWLVMLGFLPGCAEYLEWHQRITLVLSTPDGTVEAAAVQAVSLETTSDGYDSVISGAAGPDGYKYHIEGQAPYVVLPSGHIVVALLMSNGSANSAPGRMALSYLGDPSIRGPENDDTARTAFAAKAVGAAVTIPTDDWPYIIVLPPNRNFGQLKPVNGAAGIPLVDLIGPGYAVESVRLEKVKGPADPITIDSVIPCLSETTPICQFSELPRDVLATRYVMRPSSFLQKGKN